MEKLIRPVFTLDINYKITPGLVTIGKYDGTHPCLTAATTADKILIHSPHRRNTSATGRVIWSESNREIATLNINQTISALIAGQILPDDDKDVLIIGTATHILVYHVHDNKDVFYKECPDGVKALTVGPLRENKAVLVMVGGNSSVHGYDHEGNEVFWTVISDVVTSLALCDFNRDGMNELLVSSEDFNVKVFKDDQIISENVETEVVTYLMAMQEGRYAYSVSNGTVGVYEQDVRLWRVKSKNFAVSLQCYDLLGQGMHQLIIGWSNGKIDCRDIRTGEVLFKDTMNSGIAGVVQGDYRSMGKPDLICVSVEGEVKGYTTTKSLTGVGVGAEQDTIRELLAKKQSLLMELRQYENNTKYNDDIVNQTDSYESNGVIPASTRLQVGIATNIEPGKKPHVEVYLSTNNHTIIRAVIIFAEGIFKGETHVVHPPNNKLRPEQSIPLYLPKDNVVDIHIKALVGYQNSIQYHVFEITRQIPKFAMYSLLPNHAEGSKAVNFVQFKINERLQRICMWINQHFLLAEDLEYESGPNLKVHFRCLRDDNDFSMNFEQNGKVTFNTSSMNLAADLIQSLATFLNLNDLESTASFPEEQNNLRNLLEKLTEIQDARLRLSTDVADKMSQIRTLVVRAEDSRLNDIHEMPKYYNELNNLNKELMGGYNIRLQNYNEGLETMKTINSIIQKASRLRVGQKSSNVISFCRAAIRDNNIEGLIKILRTGEL